MSKILVIGYGNTIRGDDSAGIRAAELITNRIPDIECITLHQLLPEQAEQISVSDVVFFLDAERDIRQLHVQSMEPGTQSIQPRTHFISPDSLLSLSRELYGRVPSKAYVIGIPAEQFELSESLSELTAYAVEECAQLVETLIADIVHDR